MYESHGWYGILLGRPHPHCPGASFGITDLAVVGASRTGDWCDATVVCRGKERPFRRVSGSRFGDASFSGRFFCSSLIYNNSKEKRKLDTLEPIEQMYTYMLKLQKIGILMFWIQLSAKIVAKTFSNTSHAIAKLHLMRRLGLNWYQSFHRKRAARWEISWRSCSFKDQQRGLMGTFKGRSLNDAFDPFSVGAVCLIDFWKYGPDPEKNKKQGKRPL